MGGRTAGKRLTGLPVSKILGIDLGGTRMRLAVYDRDRAGLKVRAITRYERPVDPIHRSPNDLAKQIAREVGSIGEVHCIGIGMAAMCNRESRLVENAPAFGWRQVPFLDLLEDALPLPIPVALNNDLSAISIAEALFGAAKNCTSALSVFVGTGVGAGLVIEGRLYEGVSQQALEIGHLPARLSQDEGPELRLCGCGKHGCIEAYAGGANLGRIAREEIASGRIAVDIHPDEVRAEHLFAAAKKGNKRARQLVNRAADVLGAGIADAVTLLNPEVLVLGGGVLGNTSELRERAIKTLRANANPEAMRVLHIRNAGLDDFGGTLGAAYLALP